MLSVAVRENSILLLSVRELYISVREILALTKTEPIPSGLRQGIGRIFHSKQFLYNGAFADTIAHSDAEEAVENMDTRAHMNTSINLIDHRIQRIRYFNGQRKNIKLVLLRVQLISIVIINIITMMV